MQITELALAYWRLCSWVEKADVDRKNAANSALGQIRTYLSEQGVEIIDFIGQKYDGGLAVDVLDNADPDCEPESLIVAESIRPAIIQNGNVVKYGQVIIGRKIADNRQKLRSVYAVNPQKGITALLGAIDCYCTADYRDGRIVRKFRHIKDKLSGQLQKINRQGGKHT